MRYSQTPIIRMTMMMTLATGLGGCPHPTPEDTTRPIVDNSLSPQDGSRILGELAAESCQKRVKGKSFEDFKQQVFKEKGPDGVYITQVAT